MHDAGLDMTIALANFLPWPTLLPLRILYGSQNLTSPYLTSPHRTARRLPIAFPGSCALDPQILDRLSLTSLPS